VSARATIRDVRVTVNSGGDPVLRVDLTLADGGGTTDRIVVHDADDPKKRGRCNASTRRLLALAGAAGVDLSAVMPEHVSDTGDFDPLVKALRGQSVEVDVRGKRVRYVKASPPPRVEACDEPIPKAAPLIYFTSGQHEGELIPCAANAMAILATDPDWRGVLAFDEFEGTVVALKKPPWYAVDAPASERWKPGPITDTDATRTHAWFARKHRMVLSATAVNDAINAVAESKIVHPSASTC
jgi:hypothetical protein